MSPLQKIRHAFSIQNLEEQKAQTTTGNSDGFGFNQTAFDKRETYKERMRKKLVTQSTNDILGNPNLMITKRASSHKDKRATFQTAKAKSMETTEKWQKVKEREDGESAESDSGSGSTSFDIESENNIRESNS